MKTDTRTREQHMADVASATMHRLDLLAEELEHLNFQLLMLGQHSHESDADLAHGLLAVAFAAEVVGSDQAQQLVERVAANLPTRPAEGWAVL